MSDLVLNTAIGNYGLTNSLKDGTLTSPRFVMEHVKVSPVPMIFRRMVRNLEFDVAEMALAGDIGAELTLPAGIDTTAFLFGEDQARYVIAAPAAEAEAVMNEAKAAGIPAINIGETGGDALTLAGCAPISLAALRDAHEGWLPTYMAAE